MAGQNKMDSVRSLKGGLYDVVSNKWIVPPTGTGGTGTGTGGGGGEDVYGKYSSLLNAEIKNLYDGRYGIKEAREKVIQILQREFPNIDVASDIYSRVPDQWEQYVGLEGGEVEEETGQITPVIKAGTGVSGITITQEDIEAALSGD